MSERFFCLDCLCVKELDVHGRCSVCGSEAVAVAQTYGTSYFETRTAWFEWAKNEVEAAAKERE